MSMADLVFRAKRPLFTLVITWSTWSGNTYCDQIPLPNISLLVFRLSPSNVTFSVCFGDVIVQGEPRCSYR